MLWRSNPGSARLEEGERAVAVPFLPFNRGDYPSGNRLETDRNRGLIEWRVGFGLVGNFIVEFVGEVSPKSCLPAKSQLSQSGGRAMAKARQIMVLVGGFAVIMHAARDLHSAGVVEAVVV